MSDKRIIYAEDAIKAVHDLYAIFGSEGEWVDRKDVFEAIDSLPSAQPEQLKMVQDILQYLDEYLHPIVSPEHWSVYSVLYDMVSVLSSAQPEKRTEEHTETHACDLISRQDAIDVAFDVFPDDEYFREQFVKGIEALPPAQPEIIRCKDCEHYKFADNRAFGFPVKHCEVTGFEDVDDDDFCSRAERR